MVQAHKKSAYRLEVTVNGIESGLTVTKAYFAVVDTPETSTPLLKITSSSIVNDTGKATIRFQIPQNGLDSVPPGTYSCGVKVILSDGTPIMVSESVQPFVVVPPFIEDVS